MAIELEDRGTALENEYFRRKEQELIEKMKEQIASEDTKNLEIQCPKCEGKLVETNFDKIKIDVCNKCSGVWFDVGELAHVIDKNYDSGWLNRFFA